MKGLMRLEEAMAGAATELPELSLRNKNLLVTIWPWVALIFGVLQVLCLFSLWEAVHMAQRLSFFEYSVHEATQFTITMAYINMGLVAVMAAALLLAYAPLRAKVRRGWELLFIVGVLNTISAIIAFFTYGQGIASSLFSLLVSIIIFYLLFQVRDRYKRLTTEE